jgi:hypothetical protein
MNYEIVSTICLCAFLPLFILTCWFVFDCDPYPVHFISYYTSKHGGLKQFIKDFFIGYVLPALTILSITFGIFFNAKADDEKYAKINDVLSSGYTLYINGIETDASHITLEDYNLSAITIEDEIREVHIAGNKTSRFEL